MRRHQSAEPPPEVLPNLTACSPSAPLASEMLRPACSTTTHGSTATAVHRHFGEPPPPCSGMCDICAAAKPPSVPEDCTPAAQALLAVLEAGFKVKKHATLAQLLDAWHKSKVRTGQVSADHFVGHQHTREKNLI